MSIENLSLYTFVSIGENCLFQDVIRRHGFKTAVGPFSWGRSNIDYVIDLVKEDFVDLLNPNFLIHREMWGLAPATNIKYICKPGIYEKSVCNGFEFTHKDVISSVDDKENTERKIQRFKEIVLNPTGPLVLTYHYRYVPNAIRDTEYVIKKLKELRSLISTYRDGDAPEILMAQQTLVDTTEERNVYLEVIDDIHVANFSTRSCWTGKDDYVFGVVDDDLFDQCFKDLKKTISRKKTDI